MFLVALISPLLLAFGMDANRGDLKAVENLSASEARERFRLSGYSLQSFTHYKKDEAQPVQNLPPALMEQSEKLNEICELESCRAIYARRVTAPFWLLGVMVHDDQIVWVEQNEEVIFISDEGSVWRFNK